MDWWSRFAVRKLRWWGGNDVPMDSPSCPRGVACWFMSSSSGAVHLLLQRQCFKCSCFAHRLLWHVSKVLRLPVWEEEANHQRVCVSLILSMDVLEKYLKTKGKHTRCRRCQVTSHNFAGRLWTDVDASFFCFLTPFALKVKRKRYTFHLTHRFLTAKT